MPSAALRAAPQVRHDARRAVRLWRLPSHLRAPPVHSGTVSLDMTGSIDGIN